MQVIPVDALSPVVRIANHHPVDPGRVWGPRTIPDLQFIAPLRGRLLYHDAAGEVACVPGQVLVILPDTPHTVGLDPRDRAGEITGMHLELVPDARWAAGDYRCEPPPPRVTTPADPELVTATFVRAAATFKGYGRLRQARLRAIALEAVLLLAESWTAAPSAKAGSKVAAMVEHIRANAKRGVDRRELAYRFGCTPEHVNALFKRELGLSPRDVLNHERCRIAYHLIHDLGKGVGEAATAAGYADAFYFSRVFKRIYQVTPSRSR